MSNPSGFVAFVGSRHWTHGTPLVAPLVAAVAARGKRIHVGCCVGAAAAVMQSALQSSSGPVRLQILCAFGPDGVGAGPASAAADIAHLAALGILITWWAGGRADVPLVARLANRTRALLSGADYCGAIAFLQSAPSARSGSWIAARFAATRRMPVVVVAPWVTPAHPLPPLTESGGIWRPCFRSLGTPAFVWTPAQASLDVLPPSTSLF